MQEGIRVVNQNRKSALEKCVSLTRHKGRLEEFAEEASGTLADSRGGKFLLEEDGAVVRKRVFRMCEVSEIRRPSLLPTKNNSSITQVPRISSYPHDSVFP